jgi:hypothetical protein
MLQRPANNVLNRMTDLIPGRSETQRAIFPRQLARPVRQVQQLGLGQAVSAHCPLPIAHCPLPIPHSPGHSLDLHPAGFALHAPHGVQQHHAITSDREELESACGCGQQVVSGRNSAAARTMRLGASAWTHVDLDDAGQRRSIRRKQRPAPTSALPFAMQSCPRRRVVGACDEPNDPRGGQLVSVA